METVHLGLDDTDSSEGMCTTYLATLIVERLLDYNCEFLDYPNLIRLNPNIPWKTRGNAAICLRFRTDLVDAIFNECRDMVSMYSESKRGKADPGLVLLKSHKIPGDFRKLSERALHTVISRSEVVKILKQYKVRHYQEGSGRGLIGALSAIGNSLDKDHTYELIAYRPLKANGPRKIDLHSIFHMDEATKSHTFNNLDPEEGRILISSHGPDPVLFGIRGEDPHLLKEAASMLRLGEPKERMMIFRSNQGTGEHLREELDPQAPAYNSGKIRGMVSENPMTGRGGHVFFSLENSKGALNCAVYEPTGSMKKKAALLQQGDSIEVGGGIRKKGNKHGKILNVEYLKVLALSKSFIQRNPLCSNCGKKMTSDGYVNGFKCGSCKTRSRRVQFRVSRRMLKRGLYLPHPSAQRHLSKPLQRHGREKDREPARPSGMWFEIF